jgi:phosphoglycerate dehydrogenase-like enzyme
MPVALITPEAMREQPAPYVRILREAGFEVRYPKNPRFARGLGGPAEVIDELQGVHAVIASGEAYTSDVLEALPQLRVIARAGVGYDKVDVAAASRHGIPVTITPTSNHEAVAELTLALLLAATKSIVVNDRAVREGNWPRKLLRPIRRQVMGILGLGRIGRSTAVRAAALGMRVLATEAAPWQEFVEQHAIELVDFPTLLAESDFLSIHCPLTAETEGLFNAQVFARMKVGSVLINTARGRLVVERDLVEALRNGPLSAAALDVFEQEPPDSDNPLFKLDNVVLSPHLAGTDELSLEGMGVEAADCIVKLYQGTWPEGAVVNEQLRDTWRWNATDAP